METNTIHMPGYRVNEYQLVLNPHEDLRNKIRQVRETFLTKYKIPFTRHQPVSLCLARFHNREMMEEKILHRMQLVAMGLTPFKVELNNFGSFPSHSIFIRVETRQPIQNLVNQLKPHQRLLKMNNEFKPLFIDEPYFLLASRLKPWQYEEGWLEYSQKHFTGRFIADNMLLLKRPAGEKKFYQIVKRFDFQDLPIITKQGSFF
jgi:2'-5' RNA ligase